jgi:hypothetical protein
MAQHGADHEPTQTRPRPRLNLLAVGDCAGVRASAHGSFPGDPYPSRGPVDLLIFMSLLPCLSLILLFPCFVKTFLSLVREFIDFPRQLHHSFCCSTTITLFFTKRPSGYMSRL